MEINKIPEIINIGSFKNFKDKNILFAKNNIVYALNGYGKSTLTAIIRSLKENNNNIILGRKNLKEPRKENVKALIQTKDNKNYLYQNGSWRVGGNPVTTKNTEIIIFDDEFVNDNIFAERFEIDHKKALYRIIFGADGIKLSKDLTKLRNTKKEIVNKIALNENKINTEYYSIADFVKLDETKFDTTNIQTEIDNLNKRVTNSTNISQIVGKELLSKLNYIELNQNQLLKALKKQVNSEAHLKAKIEIEKFKVDYFKDSSEFEKFIRIGNDNYKTHCPFCHKILDNELLLNTYKDFFDTSYGSFKKEIENKINSFEKINLQVLLNNTNNIASSNSKLYIDWKEKFTIKNDLEKIVIENTILDLKKEIEKINTSKRQNLNEIPNEKYFAEFKRAKVNINCKIRHYNQIVDAINKEIKEFKKTLSLENVTELQKEIKKNKDILYRLKPETKSICKNIELEKDKLEKNSTDIENKQKQLDNYSKNINKEYLDAINEILKDELLVDTFKLNSIAEQSKATAKDAYVEIYIELLSKKISMYSYKDDKPSFKNTLSRGDKNTLAFAFFLAFMRKKQGLENVCLVFDDPLSSHDENRQAQTAFTIMKLADKVSQTFLLTHKKSFLRSLFDKFNDTAKYFEIKKSELTGSLISVLDKKDIPYKDEYEKIIDKFNNYLLDSTNSDLSIGNLQNDIRKALEKVLKTKYYNTLKDCSFSITSYNHLDDYFFKPEIIKDNSKAELIDLAQVSNSGSHFKSYEDMNTEEIKTVIKRALKLIEKI